MWQDYAFTIGELVFIAGLVPTLLDSRAEVPRWKTSVPVALTLLVFSYTHYSLSLPIAAVFSILTAGLWFGIAWLRPIHQYPEEVQEIPQFEVTLEEAQLIHAHREWIIEQDRLWDGGIEEIIAQATQDRPHPGAC